MNDVEYEAQKARIVALQERWVKPIGLGGWRIKTAYRREAFTDDRFTKAAMICTAKWQYMEALIEVSCSKIADMGDDELEQAYVHELGHIFLNEMAKGCEKCAADGQASNHEERVATTLALAFIWLRDSLSAMGLTDA